MAESVAITPEAMRKASEGLQKTKVIKSEQLQSSGVTDINSNYKSSSEKSSKSKKSPKTKSKKSKKEGSKSPEESKKKGSKSPKESKKTKEGKVETPVSSSKTAEIKSESQEQELAKPKEQERVPLEQKHEVKVQQQKVLEKGIPQQMQKDVPQQKQVQQKVQVKDVPQPKPQDIPQQKQVQRKVQVKDIQQQKQQDILQEKQVLQKVQEKDVPQPKHQDMPQQKQVQQKVQEKDVPQQKQQNIPQQKQVQQKVQEKDVPQPKHQDIPKQNQVDKDKRMPEKDKLQREQSSVKPQQQKQEKQQANQQKQQQVQDRQQQNGTQQPAKKTQQPQKQPVKDKPQQPQQQQQKSPPIPVPKHVATPLSINIESVDSNKSVDAADGDKKKPKVPYSPLRIDLKPFDYESLSPRSPNSPSAQSWSPKTPKTPTSPYSPPYLGARPRNRPSPKKVVECIQLVSDDTDPNPAVTMEAQSSQDVWDKCSKSLADAGATDEFSHFFADILRTEHDMNGTLNRLQQALGPENTMGRGKDPAKMLKVTQDLVKNYNQCKTSVEILQERGKKIPPLTLDPKKVKGLNALTSMCKLETKELNLQEGDQIWITDTSRPNRLKIRNSRGEEGYVPALCAILPTPDKSAVTAVERLQIQLLASWVENVKKMRKLMMDCLLTTSKVLNSDWRALMADGSRTANKDRITRRLRRLSDLITKTAPNWDLNKLHNALFSLEKELDTWQINGTDISNMVDTIANLDKTVLCYQMFTKQLYLFRKSLERVSRPIRIVESWDNLRAVQKGRFFRYIELKVTMESTETVEEIMEYIAGVTQYKEGSKNETVEADQITSASQEERKRFVITGVTHPRNGEVISLQEAVRTGVIDHSRGMYMNPLTGQGISIPEAMNRGFIKVEQTTTTKSKEETKAVGLITIKTKIDNRSYTITGAVDSVTGQQLTPEAARDQGFLDEANGQYIMKTGERIPLDNAIQSGWVLVEYEPEPQDTEYDMKTYAVNAVVDQKLKQRVPFMEAVKRGLIDRDTGSYINNVTGERVYVAEAIKRGFLKAKELEDAKGLDIDSENRVVIERMEKIRKNVLKSMGVISAFRTAAGIKKEEDIQ